MSTPARASAHAPAHAPPPDVRAHYRDFYDGPPPTGRPLLVAVGNCQAESLRLMIDGDDVATVRLPAIHELTAYDLEPLRRLMARADLLVAQPVAADHRDLPIGTDQLVALGRPSLRVALVPPIRFAGLYPHHLVVHPPGLPDPDPPVVAYHDVRTVLAGVRARTDAPPVEDPALTPAQVHAVADASRAELARRETLHGTVVVSDLLAAPDFASMRTVNHPGNAVLVPVAARVRAALGLDARPPGVERPLLDAVHAPRDPVVASVFDPGADPRDSWLVEGVEVSVADVRAAHLRFYAERPDVLDAVLERSRDFLALLLPGRAG